MIILDPDRDGCTVWLINSPVSNKSKVTHIRGNTFEVCKSLISRLAEYKEVENQWGNCVSKLFWRDYVYLDITSIGRVYKDMFERYGLYIIDITAKSPNTIIPERTHV